MDWYNKYIIQNNYSQEELAGDDDLQVQEQAVELEESIFQLVINPEINHQNSQALKAGQDRYILLFLFLFLSLELAELAELLVVGPDKQEDYYIEA